MIDDDDVQGLLYIARKWVASVSLLNKEELAHMEFRLRSMARHHDKDDGAALVLLASIARVYIDNYDTAE